MFLVFFWKEESKIIKYLGIEPWTLPQSSRFSSYGSVVRLNLVVLIFQIFNFVATFFLTNVAAVLGVLSLASSPFLAIVTCRSF